MTTNSKGMSEQAPRAIEIEFAQLAALVETQLNDAILALERRDIASAERVIAGDAKIDALNRAIDEKVLGALKAGPMPDRSLRQAVSYMKLAGELERVGDLAKNVAKRTIIVSRERPAQSLIAGVVRMGRASLRQLSDILSALQAANLSAAKAVWRGDTDLDELYNSLYRDLMNAMMADAALVSTGVHLLFIVKNFERIGDHATNIAEAVHFVETGSPFMEIRPKVEEPQSVSPQADRG
ncbi:MAG TPA: phosphate signaling complex protein PhoU [Parvularculaceae bacterium]|nr:phosphate signaling complex protein PhoU [Parvularculaceae bacterium]HNS85372.1 phosphate signaling complex protein PhoU [Parvularculaceae bacterium]